MNIVQNQLIRWIETHTVSDIVILTDEKISQLYPDYFNQLKETYSTHTILLPEGEKSKNIDVCRDTWEKMLSLSIDRNTLIINWGGGSISDTGGYIAGCYKRGIRYINIPTTLLAMIDAAIGGKTGINFAGVKNAVGLIYLPETVLTDASFLNTLPYEELRSGYGELIKYAMIDDDNLWEEIKGNTAISPETIDPCWIQRCSTLKKKITSQDLYDHDLRRVLNFGHTVGHAIESYCMTQGTPINHGHAVALGIICESHISWQLHRISKCQLDEISQYIKQLYPLPALPQEANEKMLEFCLNDKKNNGKCLNITLLDEPGQATPNYEISTDEVLASLHHLRSIYH